MPAHLDVLSTNQVLVTCRIWHLDDKIVVPENADACAHMITEVDEFLYMRIEYIFAGAWFRAHCYAFGAKR